MRLKKTTAGTTRLILLAAVCLLAAGCAVDPAARAERPGADLAAQVAEIALEMRGQPYKWGGEAPGGFDCSGLVKYAYTQAGLEVPRTAEAQHEAIRPLFRHQLLPGDLVFFRTRSAISATHVGIYVGDDRFVHALNPSKPVHAARLDSPYWQRHLIGAGSLPQQ